MTAYFSIDFEAGQAKSATKTCDKCNSQEDRHYCLLHSCVIKNMDIRVCKDFEEKVEVGRANPLHQTMGDSRAVDMLHHSMLKEAAYSTLNCGESERLKVGASPSKGKTHSQIEAPIEQENSQAARMNANYCAVFM